MQDVATPHIALSTREFLKAAFRNQITLKTFRKVLASDLIPVDFYLGPTLKLQMYTGSQPYTSTILL